MRHVVKMFLILIFISQSGFAQKPHIPEYVRAQIDSLSKIHQGKLVLRIPGSLDSILLVLDKNFSEVTACGVTITQKLGKKYGRYSIKLKNREGKKWRGRIRAGYSTYGGSSGSMYCYNKSTGTVTAKFLMGYIVDWKGEALSIFSSPEVKKSRELIRREHTFVASLP